MIGNIHFNQGIVGVIGDRYSTIAGKITLGDVGNGVTGFVSVEGGLISAEVVENSLSKAGIVVMIPPQVNNEYNVDVGIEGVGDRDNDNDLEQVQTRDYAYDRFAIYLYESNSVAQDLKLNVTITKY